MTDLKTSNSSPSGDVASLMEDIRRRSTQMSNVNKEFQENNAVDGRKMRRIIAEDPEWNLMTVPLLSELCTKAIVKHFQTHPRHDELPSKYRKKVLEQIPTSLPLDISASLISEESYWERCCKAKWRVNDVSKHGASWKRMYFEREIKHLVENFVPNKTDPTKLNNVVRLGAPFVIKLDIQQLLPPVELEKKEFNLDNDDDEDEQDKEEIKEKYDCDHFDFSTLIPALPRLEELRVSYGVKDCGMNFEWQLFDFSKKDCQVLAKCVAQCKTLKSLHINWSKVDDDKIRLFISQILKHPSLVELNLAHNLISDRGCRAIGKFINGNSQIQKLNLCNNQIRAQGAQAIAHALIKNNIIKELDLRLNRIGDEGGQAIAKALMKNTSLVRLNLASNNMTQPAASLISVAIAENKTLRYLDLSSNHLGTDGVKAIQESIQNNESLLELDLRLTDAGQESEHNINKVLRKNAEIDRTLRVDKENQLYRSFDRTFSHIF